MIHHKITIVARGKTAEDVAAAVEEAIKRYNAGNESGADTSDDGGFYFQTTEDVPKNERVKS